MLLRRFMEHVHTQNWFAVVLDLLVVIVGLFIGLQIDTWWEEQREAQLESVYLEEIREDFEANKSNLEEQIRITELILENMISLHAQSLLPEPELSLAELNNRFTSIHNMPTFVLTRRAFDNLTGSGDLKLIKSRALKNALAEYYAAAELVAVVQATHEMELVETFQPYIIGNLDYASVKPVDTGEWLVYENVDDFPLGVAGDEGRIAEVLGTRLFRNVVVQKWVISRDLLDQFRGMLKRNEQVLDMLD
ncbi:MAG: hypothetical protein R3192_07985 [Woeseiaceae bacterium]|nr:hypothetical protein [Woeseiaceae bacterium]